MLQSISHQLYDLYMQGEWFFCQTASNFYTTSSEAAEASSILKKLDAMRGTQLRNLLVQDLHVPKDIIDKIIDRSELRELARQSLSLKYVEDCHDTFFTIILTTAVLAALIALMIIFQKTLKKYFKYASSLFIDGEKFRKKLKLAKYCSRQFATYFGFIAILLSIALELVVVWINTSVILSWITPRYWEVRKYMFFGLYLPVSTEMLQQAVRGGRGGSSRQGNGDSMIGNWSINIGSLITLAALKWICSKLDDFAAYQLKTFKEAEEKVFLHTPLH